MAASKTRVRLGAKVLTPRSVLNLARHEAAHAVLALKLGVRIDWAELWWDGKKTIHGGVKTSRKQPRGGPVCAALVLMAGSVSDNLRRVAPVGVVSAGDLADLKALGLGSPDDMRALYLATRPLVLKWRGAIERVARALARRGKLSAAEIARLARGSRK